MQMIQSKIKVKTVDEGQIQELFSDLNECLRHSHGFISGILLRSNVSQEILYYMSMWMDEECAKQGRSHLLQFLKENKSACMETSEDSMEVLLSVTAEGDFKPIVN